MHQASEQSASTSQSYETLVPLGADAEVLLRDFQPDACQPPCPSARLLFPTVVHWPKATRQFPVSTTMFFGIAAASS